MKRAWIGLIASASVVLAIMVGSTERLAAQAAPPSSTPSPVAGDTLRQFPARAGIQKPIGPGEKLFGINLDCPIDTKMDMSRHNPDPDMLRVQLTGGKVVGIYLPTGRMVSFTQLFGFGDPDDASESDGSKGTLPKEKAIEIAQGVLKEMGVEMAIGLEDIREHPVGGPHWQIIKPLTYQGIPADSVVRIVLTAKSGRVRAFSASPFEYSGPTVPTVTKEQAIAAVVKFEQGKGMTSGDESQYEAELCISRPNNEWNGSGDERGRKTGGHLLCWNVRHSMHEKQMPDEGHGHGTLFLVDALTGKICGGARL